MATLTNQTVASTYPMLLKMAATGVDATVLRTVEDGDATSSALQMSAAAVKSLGTLTSLGDFDVNTDKFTVVAASGNTVVAGTLGVTGVITATGGVAGDVTGDVTGAVTGNADTATTLQTARNIVLTGDVTGTASFNGSAEASITASLGNTAVASGSYTNSDITVSADGRLTSAANGSDSGKVLQVVFMEIDTATFSSTSTSMTDVTGLSATITPSATTSKILVQAMVSYGTSNSGHGAIGLTQKIGVAAASQIGLSNEATSSRVNALAGIAAPHNASNSLGTVQVQYLATPATTSSTVYQITAIMRSGGHMFTLNKPQADIDADYTFYGTSTITLTEIAG